MKNNFQTEEEESKIQKINCQKTPNFTKINTKSRVLQDKSSKTSILIRKQNNLTAELDLYLDLGRELDFKFNFNQNTYTNNCQIAQKRFNYCSWFNFSGKPNTTQELDDVSSAPLEINTDSDDEKDEGYAANGGFDDTTLVFKSAFARKYTSTVNQVVDRNDDTIDDATDEKSISYYGDLGDLGSWKVEAVEAVEPVDEPAAAGTRDREAREEGPGRRTSWRNKDLWDNVAQDPPPPADTTRNDMSHPRPQSRDPRRYPRLNLDLIQPGAVFSGAAFNIFLNEQEVQNCP